MKFTLGDEIEKALVERIDAIRAAWEAELAGLVKRAEVSEAALREVVDLFPTDEEGISGHYDRVAMEFYRETGVWPPGKSAPMEMLLDEDDDVRHAKWVAWNEARRSVRVARARAVLAVLDAAKEGT